MTVHAAALPPAPVDPTVFFRTGKMAEGDFRPLSQAMVPVTDRGFTLAQSIYEVVNAPGGNLYRWEEHLDRMTRGMHEAKIANPYSREQWLTLTRQVLHAFGPRDQCAYFQVTAGAVPLGVPGLPWRDHPYPPAEHVQPTVLIAPMPVGPHPEAVLRDGVDLRVKEDIRWKRNDIKSTALLGAVMLKNEALSEGGYECILTDPVDGVREAAAANFWMIQRNDDGTHVVVGAASDNNILEGIRCGVVKELCDANGVELQRRRIDPAELATMEGGFLSSATKGLVPVTSANGQPIGDGRPHHVFSALKTDYDQRIEAVRAQTQPRS